jgi:putative Mg2+ transporter-C (MgtC) family protein
MIGLEREIHHKSAGLRTHTLVGIASALIMLVSKYGFTDVLVDGRVVLDPSRVAAQVVSGIGFIGGGLIFVRRDSVRGLTTAAIVWITASIGMACGAGLPILAMIVTAGHFIVVFTFPHLVGRLPNSRWAPSVILVSCEEKKEILLNLLAICKLHDFAVSRLKVQQAPLADFNFQKFGAELGVSNAQTDSSSLALKPGQGRPQKIFTVVLDLQGIGSIAELAAKLVAVDGVVSVSADDGNVPSD